MKKFFIASIALLLFSTIGFSQSDFSMKSINKEVNKQRTANSKDILTSFFRASLDNLLGSGHSFTLNSSFYGLDSIFRHNGMPARSYEAERRLRWTSLNFTITGDSSNNIVKYSGGLSITLLNKKDVTLSRMDMANTQRLRQLSFFMSAFKKSVHNIISHRHPEAMNNFATNTEITNSINKADAQDDYSKLHPYVKEALNDPDFIAGVAAERNALFTMSDEEIAQYTARIKAGEDAFQTVYSDIAAQYRNKPLWTFSPSVSYDRVSKQAEYYAATYFTVGLTGNPERKPWELEANASFKVGPDSVSKTSNYNNKFLSASLGVNKVLMQTEEKESKMEFKLFTQYDQQFGTVAPGAEKHVFTLNTTLRVNVFKSLWLPLTLKYDPENGNFLGIFAVTANIGN